MISATAWNNFNAIKIIKEKSVKETLSLFKSLFNNAVVPDVINLHFFQ